jgi:hypothetical protein
MPSPISGLLQTIIALRQLQMQQAAQELQREQLGISRQNSQLGAQQGFQSMLQGLDQPTSMMPFAGQYAQTTGLSQPNVETMIQHTPAASATTRSRSMQSGAQQLGGSQDVAGATQLISGQTPSETENDKLMKRILGETSDYYSTLTPEQRQGFHKGVLQRVTTGQDVGSAAASAAQEDFFSRANKETKDRIVAIGKGLLPSGSEDEQMRLGWARYRQEEKQLLDMADFRRMQLAASESEARQRLDAAAFKELDDLIKASSGLLEFGVRSSSTLTPEGMADFRQKYNAMNEQIRRIAPDIYGPKGSHPIQDLPKGTMPGATGFFDFLNARIQQSTR